MASEVQSLLHRVILQVQGLASEDGCNTQTEDYPTLQKESTLL